MNTLQLESALAQTYLSGLGIYQGKIDGIWGKASQAAANAWLRKNAAWMAAPTSRMAADEYLRALAAQYQLQSEGLYKGELDGEFGPLSKAGALAWQNPGQPPAKPLPAPEPTHWNLPYDVAKQYLGTKEIPGAKNNPLIVRWLRRLATWINDDETAWCSAFVNFCADEAGYESTGKLNARSWLEVGEIIPLQYARKGDVVIFWRGSRSGWQGHVAFLDHYNPQRDLIYHLGGNQNNEVNITTTSPDRLLGVRRLRSLDRLQGGSNKI